MTGDVASVGSLMFYLKLFPGLTRSVSVSPLHVLGIYKSPAPPPRLRAQTADPRPGRDPACSLAGVTAPSQGPAALVALMSPPQAPAAPVLGSWW